MADLVSLPVSAPVAAPVAGLGGLLDGALAMPAAPVADPFAAFMATAQALPAITAQPAAIVAVPKILPVTLESVAATTDVEVATADGEAAQIDTTDQPEIVVDPALTPALAMLSALVTPPPATSRPATSVAKPQPVIAAKTLTAALIKAPTTPIAMKPAIDLTAPTIALLAPASPGLATMPVSLDVPVATASPQGTVDTPVTAQIIASAAAVPTLSATPLPVAPPGQLPTPAIDHADAAVISAPFQPVTVTPAGLIAPRTAETAIVAETATSINPALADQPDTPAETTTPDDPIAPDAAPAIKPRAVEPRIVQAERADASSPPTRTARVRPVTPTAEAPVRIAPDTARVDPVIAAPVAVAAAPISAATTAQIPTADLLVQRQLIIADDGRWLDSLAQDIAKSASDDTIRFRLEPVNLGSLTVAIAQGSDGAAVRLTAETHRARDLLVDAQPALVAEARANGLRISETHVDLGSGNRENSHGNASTGGQPSFANNASGQQAMRQDANARRQPDLPTPSPQSSNQPRPTAARATARDTGERFA